jgi:phosphatidylserine/phosphatidylglycerophosphate/cardiolipin synthase-like enzyme
MRYALVFTAVVACSSPPRAATAPQDDPATIELVETAPIETTLDHADIREAAVVWPEMIGRARTTIDVAEFYASDAEGAAEKTSRLGPVLAAIERATRRGVRVRFLVDKSFAPKYPATIGRLEAARVVVRPIDAAAHYGGIQHAKYMIVDGEESFVGSQNFDWRALEHIQEMGARVHSRAFARALTDVFDTDWALTGAGAPRTRGDENSRARPRSGSMPSITAQSGERLELLASPRGWLPDESHWDLTRLVALLDAARTSIAVQVLTYGTTNRDKSPFTTLDDALRRAAARGVRVRLLVSHWGARGHARLALEAIAARGIDVRILEIPRWSGGEIPFARVAHAKFMVVDGATAWIGTSNWEGDYFLKTRNVAVVASGGSVPGRLARVFEDDWSSAYTKPLKSDGDAPPSDSDPARQ